MDRVDAGQGNAATVQGTNDSSIVSKASMSSMGYFRDEFLKYFVKKVKRRAPLINRGYYVRMKAIDYFLTAFLKSGSDILKTKQIISLGAGFDSSYFKLKNADLLKNVIFYEVDYQEVVDRKRKLITGTEILRNLLDGTVSFSPGCLDSNQYKLIGCDLNYVQRLDQLLQDHKIDYQIPTFILSECVMTYMQPERCSSLIKWASERFKSAMFVCYEQIYPQDAFGKVMQNHFIKLQSPLRCIQEYPTMNHQIRRFQNLGWNHVEAMDMNFFYNNYLPRDEQSRIDFIEPFDEFEEWHLKCSHYAIVTAFSKDMLAAVDTICHTKQSIEECSSKSYIPRDIFGLSSDEFEAFQRFGHSCCKISPTDVLICGGSGVDGSKHTRLKNGCLISFPSDWPENTTISHSEMFQVFPDPLLFGSLAELDVSRFMMFGGRNSPVQPYGKTMIINIGSQAQTGGDSIHSSTRPYETCASFNINWISKKDNNESRPNSNLRHSGFADTFVSMLLHTNARQSPAGRWRHTVSRIKDSDDPREEYIFMCGGRNQDSLSLADCWLFHLRSNSWTEVASLDIGRHSHSATTWNDDVIIYGGLNAESVALNTLNIIRLKGGVIKMTLMDFDSPLPARYSHSAHVIGDYLIVVGGIDPQNCCRDDILVIDLVRRCWKGFSFPDDAFPDPVMLHNHCSVVTKNNILFIIGGGGNCFSFGTHLNKRLLYINLNQLMDSLGGQVS